MQRSSYQEHIRSLQASYQRALETTGFESLIIHSGRGLRQRSVDDQYWPLKANPSFSHWLPLNEPDALLVIRPGAKPKLLRPLVEDFWHGAAPVPGDYFWDSFELLECKPEDMASQLKSAGDCMRAAWIGDVTEVADELGIDVAAQNPAALMAQLDAVRARKSSYEVACLVEASRIATRGHQRVAELFASGDHSELELHLAYLQATAQDSTETPYSNIVALGPNAAVLHHVHYTRGKDANPEQSLLIDAGATHMGYASDITRTMVRGTSAQARDFGALIAAVEALELSLCAEVKPGLHYEDLHNKAHQLLAEVLIEAQLCTGSAEALVKEGVTRAFFPHGLGHSLGLQVHDVGCKLVPPADTNAFLRNTSLIEEGQVFTIEPGCYIIDSLLGPLKNSPAGALINWSSVDAMRPFGGIRIEDNLAVSADSSVNLTRDNWPT